jgi:hypothetical protein
MKIKILTIINLSIVLYGFDTWSLSTREEYRVRVFVKRGLRITWAKKVYNEELHNLYSSLNIIPFSG